MPAISYINICGLTKIKRVAAMRNVFQTEVFIYSTNIAITLLTNSTKVINIMLIILTNVFIEIIFFNIFQFEF